MPGFFMLNLSGVCFKVLLLKDERQFLKSTLAATLKPRNSENVTWIEKKVASLSESSRGFEKFQGERTKGLTPKHIVKNDAQQREDPSLADRWLNIIAKNFLKKKTKTEALTSLAVWAITPYLEKNYDASFFQKGVAVDYLLSSLSESEQRNLREEELKAVIETSLPEDLTPYYNQALRETLQIYFYSGYAHAEKIREDLPEDWNRLIRRTRANRLILDIKDYRKRKAILFADNFQGNDLDALVPLLTKISREYKDINIQSKTRPEFLANCAKQIDKDIKDYQSRLPGNHVSRLALLLNLPEEESYQFFSNCQACLRENYLR